MQATHGQSLGEIGVEVIRRTRTSATVVRRAPARADVSTTEFTVAQRIMRYGLTILAIAGMSALFATQIAATLH